MERLNQDNKPGYKTGWGGFCGWVMATINQDFLENRNCPGFLFSQEKPDNTVHASGFSSDQRDASARSFLCSAVGAFAFFDDPADPLSTARAALEDRR